MELQLGQREPGGREQRAQARGFELELRRVGEVLELASAAGAEVRARRRGAAGFGIEGYRFERCRHFQSSSSWGM
jgi:hypothetical protein